MTIPILYATLTSPGNLTATATFPASPFKSMAGGWVRYFSRLGRAGLRFYANERLPGLFECVAWLANAHAGENDIDWVQFAIAPPVGWRFYYNRRVTQPIQGPPITAYVLGDGQVQCLPTRRGLAVRFVMCTTAIRFAQALDVLNGTWCSIPDQVSNFGPLRQKQPHVTRSKYEDFAETDLTQIESAIANGSNWVPTMPGLDYECGIMHSNLGVWQPLGPQTPGNPGGGNPGGSDIRFLPGYDQTVYGAIVERTRLEQLIQRQLHAWDPVTGDALTVESYGDPGPQYSGSRDQYTTDGELPGFVIPANGHSACPYSGALKAYGPYDPAHLERAINPAIVAYEYLRDALAADFIVDTAEEMRLQFSDHGPTNAGQPGWQPRNLKNYFMVAQLGPHRGGDCGRYRGVPAWSVVMADKVVTELNPSNSHYSNWMRMFSKWADLCQMPNGLWQWSTDNSFGLPPGIAGAQTFEQCYFALARAACGYAIKESQPGVAILKAVDALFLNRQLPRQPDPWHPVQFASYGPPHFVYVGDLNGPYSTVSQGRGNGDGTGIGDPTNAECFIALGLMVSGGAHKYWKALLDYGWPAQSLTQKLANYNSGLEHNWDAASMQLTQDNNGGTA